MKFTSPPRRYTSICVEPHCGSEASTMNSKKATTHGASETDISRMRRRGSNGRRRGKTEESINGSEAVFDRLVRSRRDRSDVPSGLPP